MKGWNKSIFSATLCITGTMILCTILNRIELINMQKYLDKTISFEEGLKNIGGQLFVTLFHLSLILIIFGLLLFGDTLVTYLQSDDYKNLCNKNNTKF